MKPPVPTAETIITATGHEVELSQHMTALNLANHVRLARARAKNDLHAGVLTLLDAMALEECQSMTVTSLLEALPRWGHTRAEKACREVPVSPWRRVGEMVPRQRLALARIVQPHLFQSTNNDAAIAA